MKPRTQYLIAVALFLIGVIVFIILSNATRGQKGSVERTNEALECMKECFDKYSKSEESIPEELGWTSEFSKIQEDLRNCQAGCERMRK